MKSRLYHILLAGPVVLTWIWTWLYLASEWSANEQYQYGFAIPLLGLYLSFQRWPNPLPRGQRNGLILYVAAFPILLVAELLRLTDPLWRLTGAAFMTGATVLTMGYFGQLAGWALVRRMAFPLGFLWLGLPWPVPLENLVIQALSRAIAAFTTVLLNLAGIAALQRGNTIETAGQLVGIDAACSGIQSLQASLMASLFLWGSLKLLLRPGLMLQFTAMFFALLINLGRVIALTYSAHQFSSQNQTLHDCVGGIATLLLFGGIYLAAMRLRRSPGSVPANPEGDHAPLDCVATSSDPSLARQAVVFASFLMIPVFADFVIGSGSGAAPQPRPRWRVDAENLPPGWSAHSLPATPSQAGMLRFTDWVGFQVRTPDGLWADVIHLFWRTRNGMPSMAFCHTPALCLPSAGWQMIGTPDPIELHVDGGFVSFVRYLLQQENERLLALQFVGRGKRIDPLFIASNTGKGRLERLTQLWSGSRDPVNEEILIYLPEPGFGDSNMEFAAEVVSKLFRPGDR
jgi:exosortase